MVIHPKKPEKSTHYRNGTVDGMPVEDILFDTGCSRTLVHHKLISPEKRIDGEVIIRCVHGDEVSYPLARVDIGIDDQVFSVEATMSYTLPVSVL